MRRLVTYLFLIITLPTVLFSQAKTVGNTGADYSTLKAAFDAINAGTLTGSITLHIIDNTTETATATLNASGSGSANYTSVNIYPTVTGKTITGNLAAPLISLNGADNVIIDGRLNASGSSVDLTITNTSTSSTSGTSTIRFINDATNNTIKFCLLKGSSVSASGGGIIFFSSSSSGTVGNDGNTIDRNNITSDAAGRPVNVIFSSGTSGKANSENTVSNNNIYNFLKHGTASNGINIGSNTTAWTISSNSFYETSSFTPAASVEYCIIRINYGSGSNFNITGNYIGGQAVGCGGSAWTKTGGYNNTFYAIFLNFDASNSVQGNTIANFNWSNSGSASWTGIHVSTGAVNIGTVSGNTIGSSSGTGSISVTGGANGTIVYGINIASTGNVNCQNNIVGSINTSNNSTDASDIYGINKISAAGPTTISNNLIGSTTTANSINAYSASSGNIQKVTGINSSGLGDITISNNIIANLTNGTTNTSGSVTGLNFNGTTSTNAVYGNFIHSLSATGASNTASIQGIRIEAGVTTYYNNIISLGGNTNSLIYGIYETGNVDESYLFFNTVYIGGSPATGSQNSYGIYNDADGNIRDFRNNIFFNARSNNGASGKHYAISLAGTSLTIDYNDYFISGTGGVLGFLGSDQTTLSAWQAATSQDVNSLNTNPAFTSPGSTVATNYKIGVDLPGIDGTGITTDYGSFSRAVTPSMGAWERAINKWKGSISSSWNTAGNWTSGVVPDLDAQLEFDAAPSNHCILDQNRSVSNIINAQSTYRVVTNGFKLTIKGNLDFTNGAQIDASATNSTIEFAGSTAQSIPSGSFYNDRIYNLTINNSNNVVLSGTLYLLNALNATSGRLDATTNSTTFGFAGTSAQTIETNRFLSNTAYNIIIDNSFGVSLNSNFTINNALTINSGKVFNINAPSTLTVSGTITNNAGNTGLVLKSTANGSDGKLINSTSAVPATVDLYLSGGLSSSGARFHYIVPPVTQMVIIPTLPTSDSLGQARTSLGLNSTNFKGDLLNYNEVVAGGEKNKGWQYFDCYHVTTGFTTLYSTMGYNMYLATNGIMTFKGNLNATDHTFSSLSYTNLGWNLIGNPFPCNYDLNGVSELTGSGDNVDNTIYFNRDGGYAYWNVITGGTTGFSDILPPMQGFFVHLTGSATVTLPASSKTVSSALPSRSKGAKSSGEKGVFVKKVKLVLNNGAVPDEAIVCLIENATNDFDRDYDAYKLFGGISTTPFIYSVLNSEKYAINTIPEPGSEPSVVPLVLEIKEAGNYTINTTEFENLEGTYVTLRHGVVETDLSLNTSYSFYSNAGTFTNFQLVFNNSVTSIEKKNTEDIKVWYNDNYFYFNSPGESFYGKANLEVFDLQGKLVFNKRNINVLPKETQQIGINLKNGAYITKFLINNKQIVSKIVVFEK